MVFTSSIKHPKEFSIVTGNTELAKEVESINQSIKLLLLTSKGELFGSPDFGSRLREYLFDYSGDTLYDILKTEIVETLMTQDSRIVVNEDDISFEEEDLTLKIVIKYSVKYTNYSAEANIAIKKEEHPWAI